MASAQWTTAAPTRPCAGGCCGRLGGSRSGRGVASGLARATHPGDYIGPTVEHGSVHFAIRWALSAATQRGEGGECEPGSGGYLAGPEKHIRRDWCGYFDHPVHSIVSVAHWGRRCEARGLPGLCVASGLRRSLAIYASRIVFPRKSIAVSEGCGKSYVIDFQSLTKIRHPKIPRHSGPLLKADALCVLDISG
jgi:hypothetical protein